MDTNNLQKQQDHQQQQDHKNNESTSSNSREIHARTTTQKNDVYKLLNTIWIILTLFYWITITLIPNDTYNSPWDFLKKRYVAIILFIAMSFFTILYSSTVVVNDTLPAYILILAFVFIFGVIEFLQQIYSKSHSNDFLQKKVIGVLFSSLLLSIFFYNLQKPNISSVNNQHHNIGYLVFNIIGWILAFGWTLTQKNNHYLNIFYPVLPVILFTFVTAFVNIKGLSDYYIPGIIFSVLLLLYVEKNLQKRRTPYLGFFYNPHSSHIYIYNGLLFIYFCYLFYFTLFKKTPPENNETPQSANNNNNNNETS
jgi:hypothetical protein